MASSQELSALIKRLEAVTTRLEGVGGAAAGAVAEDLSASVSAFDAIVSGPLQTYLTLSAKIGGDVASHSQLVSATFTAQRQFLIVASKCKSPAQATDLQQLLKPMSDNIAEIQAVRERNRRSDFFNHLSAISESISALGWVTVAPAPAPFVKEMNDAGQFYTNRVLKDWKEKDRTHVDWTKAWLSTLTELQAFVKQHHTTGLVWNKNGPDAKEHAGKATGPSAPKAGPGGPPPPPPPPPPGLFDDIKLDAANPDKQARSALFADLNKGDNVTQGLKKVTSDMQTHKNPSLRSSSVVKSSAKPAVGPKPTTAAKPTAAKPPHFALEGKKWAIEHFKDNPSIVVEQVEHNQSVYVYRCEKSTIKVNGKCNNIILDGCKKTAIVFDNVVSSCEFINCQSVQMQVLGSVPTISIDKTDGCQMYLSKESLQTEIITSKSSEMNVMIPSSSPEGDFVEQPVPEQFKTTVSGTKLVTNITESV